MNFVLLSLFSQKSKSASLMVYDLDHSKERYVQLVDLSNLPTRFHQIRGISLIGDHLYALTPCAMLIFRISSQSNKPIFTLIKTICKPEWILGDNQQGDLHAVYVSRERQRVYLSFNSQCAIDVFDLEGDFIQRQNLWDIAPDIFVLPSGRIKKGFRYGVVRHIFETEHEELVLTTALVNGKKDSEVISYDEGKSVLRIESQPIHGGLIHNDTLYVSAIQKGEVQAFTWPNNQKKPDVQPVHCFIPKITDNKWKESDQKIRGMVVKNGRLLCGVCYFGKSKPNQIPPRMVEFDLQSGEQVREHWLPSFMGLEEPQIYGLIQVSKELEQAVGLQDKPIFCQGEVVFDPIWVVKNIPPKPQIISTKDSVKTQLSKTQEKVLFQSEKRRKNFEIETKIEHDNFPSTSRKATENYPTFTDDAKVKDFERALLADTEKKVLHQFKDKKNIPLINNKVPNRSHAIADDQQITFRQPANSETVSQSSVLSSRPTVIFDAVGLCFKRAARKLLSFNKNLRNKKTFWALQDVSFTVYEGETLGVIGRNGSGKSTLSKICSGVLIPDKGKVIVNGRAHLLALGVGFKNELSGRENVFISGSLLGLNPKEIKARMSEIETFAELGEFMDEPVRTYSSGMRSRLGFAVATAVKPDILILDEIMATGDKAFQDKAIRRLRDMSGLARSIIVVSHNPGQLRKLSTRVLWLEKGRKLMLGKPQKVLNAYGSFCQSPAKWLKRHPEMASKLSLL